MAANNGVNAQKPSVRGPRNNSREKKRGELISTNLPVYMVHSSWSLSQIDKFLKQYGTVGFLRIVYDSQGKETHDLNIAILQEGMYDALVQAGRGDHGPARGLKVSPFLLHPGHFPKKGTKSTLFVPVPGPLKLDDDTVMAVINAKLQHLADWNILPPDSWSLNIPLVSRELGHIRNGCFISFLPEAKLALADIAVIRVLLTDTYWEEAKDETKGAERAVFHCHWARERGKDQGRSGRGERRTVDRKPPRTAATTKILPNPGPSQRERLALSSKAKAGSKKSDPGSKTSKKPDSDAKGSKTSKKPASDSIDSQDFKDPNPENPNPENPAARCSPVRRRPREPKPDVAPVPLSVPLPETMLPELDE